MLFALHSGNAQARNDVTPLLPGFGDRFPCLAKAGGNRFAPLDLDANNWDESVSPTP
jgi:hypothetical protein